MLISTIIFFLVGCISLYYFLRGSATSMGFIICYLISGTFLLIYIYNKTIEKTARLKREEELRKEEEKLLLQEKQISSIQTNIKKEIYNNFLIPKCSRCNDIHYELLRLNSQSDGIECRCISCNRTFWIKADKSMSKVIKDYMIILKELNGQQIKLISNYNISNDSRDRYHIQSSVKEKVWNRDGGKCVICGSNKNLEYDHIIPVSKGGSNTVRNIQLLCEKCNRSKGSKIL